MYVGRVAPPLLPGAQGTIIRPFRQVAIAKSLILMTIDNIDHVGK